MGRVCDRHNQFVADDADCPYCKGMREDATRKAVLAPPAPPLKIVLVPGEPTFSPFADGFTAPPPAWYCTHRDGGMPCNSLAAAACTKCGVGRCRAHPTVPHRAGCRATLYPGAPNATAVAVPQRSAMTKCSCGLWVLWSSDPFTQPGSNDVHSVQGCTVRGYPVVRPMGGP